MTRRTSKQDAGNINMSWIIGIAVISLLAFAFVCYLNSTVIRLRRDVIELQEEIDQLETNIKHLQEEEEKQQVKEQLDYLALYRQKRTPQDYADDAEMPHTRIRHARHRHQKWLGNNREKAVAIENKEDTENAMHFVLDESKTRQHGCTDLDLAVFRNSSLSVICNYPKDLIPFWKVQNNRHVSIGHLNQQNSKLVITRSGLYLMYAQMTLHNEVLGPSFSVSHEGDERETGHVLSRCDTSDRPLQWLRVEGANTTEGDWFFNQCFTERAVHLRAGDKVYVMNDKMKTTIRTEPFLTFWGIHLVQDKILL